MLRASEGKSFTAKRLILRICTLRKVDTALRFSVANERLQDDHLGLNGLGRRFGKLV